MMLPQLLISIRDKLHQNIFKFLDLPTTDTEIKIPKDIIYDPLKESLSILHQCRLEKPDIVNDEDFRKSVQLLYTIDTKLDELKPYCKIEDDALVCDKTKVKSSPTFEESFNMLAFHMHNLGMKQIEAFGNRYKFCYISPEIAKSKILDSNMLAFCDGIMEWVTHKIKPTVSESSLFSEGIDIDAQRLDLKMNGHGHQFITGVSPSGKSVFKMIYFDYNSPRFSAVVDIFKDLVKHPRPDFPKINSMTKMSGLVFEVDGEIPTPESARALSRFIIGTKDADFIGSDKCRKLALEKSLERAIELQHKPDITHEEEKSLISNIIACKMKCDFVKSGTTLSKWYKEEGCA